MHFCARLAAGAAALLLALFGTVADVRAAGGATLRIAPASQTVAQGGTFTVKVVLNGSVPALGAQASVTFDKSKVQIASANWGAPFSGAPVLVPSDLGSAVTQANSSGKLAKLAATYVLPTDAVAPGDAELLVITFKATGCGTVSLGLPVGPNDSSVLDGRDATVGNTLPVSGTGGTVTIDCGGGGSSPPPGASSSATQTHGTAVATEATSTEATSTEATSAQPTTAASTPETTPAVAGETATDEGASTSPAVAAAGGTAGSGGGGLPIWLPLVLSIPAIAIVGLGLLRWRRLATA